MSAPLVSHEQEVAELLARMSLRQKIGQLVQPERMAITPEEVRKHHIGSVLSGGGSWPDDNGLEDWVAMCDAYWQASMLADDSHLPVPIMYGVDAIHGHNNVQGATIFPHNIGLGAANDVALVERIAQITAREMLATGVDWTFAPTLAVARDIRWGRTYESYSDGPDIVSAYAAAVVRGLQNDLGEDGVAACAKHWVGDGGTRFGIDQGDTVVSWEALQAVHIRPFREALDAGVLSVMVSFSSWNGEKCHGHRRLLSEYLKGELGFAGVVISDWDGVEYLSPDFTEAIAAAVNAGIDVFMLSERWQEFIERLEQLVHSGVVPISRVDDAVTRMLRVKFALGLFAKPRPSERRWSLSATFGSAEHRSLAREAVRKSMVLLKNDRGVLPLSPDSRILVGGKSARSIANQCGGFTIGWQGVPDHDGLAGATTIWQAIQAEAPRAELSRDLTCAEADPKRHDVVVIVIGETPYAEGLGDVRSTDEVLVQAGSQLKGQSKVLEPYGRSLSLSSLHPEDLHCLETAAGNGVPVVAVLLSGRPLLIEPELGVADAFVAAWLPGSEGAGVADVLFGACNFQGRLSFSWPTSEQGVGHERSADEERFPAGYGLDYGTSQPRRGPAQRVSGRHR